MKAPVRSFIIRDDDGTREAETLVLGRGLRITETAGGLPELEGVHGSEVLLAPSGADDTQAINDALATGKDVRLGPGTFIISDSLVVGTAGGQRLSGSGADRTLVRLTTAGIPAVVMVSAYCTVERLRIDGTSGTTGIRAVFSSGFHVPVTIRDLSITTREEAIHLENIACDITNLTSVGLSQYGIYARNLTGTIRNVTISGADMQGIHIENGDAVICESIRVTDSYDAGIFVSGGTGYRLSAVHTEGCYVGLTVTGADLVAVDSLFIVAGFLSYGIQLDQVRNMAVNGCRIQGARSSLYILNSQNVVAGALLSDHTYAASPFAHLIVQSSSGVFVTGMRLVSQSPPPTYEVDVSLAGNRVLFGPNNIDPARINSGGNFAQL